MFNHKLLPASTPFTNQRLCHKCQTLTLSNISGDGLIFHLDFGQLSGAASDTVDGCCDLCFVIWWSLRWHSSKVGELGNAEVVLYRNPPRAGPIQRVEVIVAPEYRRREFSWSDDVDGLQHLGPPDDKPWLARGHINVYATNRSVSTAQTNPLVRFCLPETNSGSSRCLGLATHWLSNCLENHSDTCPKNLDSRLPRRVVDVGTADGKEPVRLVTSTYGQRGSYLALSYCWGQQPFFLMTTYNKPQLEDIIIFEQLPKTIQDAVILTRRLGVRYLWVDSLCIIQGTDQQAMEDWDDQSRCMNQVYRGALATILASSASAANEGIFNERCSNAQVSCRLPTTFGGDEMVQLIGVLEDEAVESEPLKQRAWAFQEEFLSIRALSFGTKQLSWKCRGSQHRECDSESTFEVRQKETDALQIHEDWASIIEEYSEKDMTLTNDKLPAIEGLARLVQAHLPPYYVAGLWEDRLVEQLLWRHVGKITPEGKRHKRLDNKRVPTWSWASVEGKVEFLKGADSAYFKTIALRDDCIVARAHVQKVATLRLSVAASYFGGYDNHLPWAVFPSSMKTFLDDLESIPQQHCRTAPGKAAELVDVSLLFLGPGCGLIMTREVGPVELGPCSYRDLMTGSDDTGDGSALRVSLELPVKRRFKRIGSFIGFKYASRQDAYKSRLPSTVIHLV